MRPSPCALRTCSHAHVFIFAPGAHQRPCTAGNRGAYKAGGNRKKCLQGIRMLRGRSFGKVYKGRWRGGMVAIKVLQHGGNVALQISALRESLLCKNIMHPNIVRPLPGT